MDKPITAILSPEVIAANQLLADGINESDYEIVTQAVAMRAQIDNRPWPTVTEVLWAQKKFKGKYDYRILEFLVAQKADINAKGPTGLSGLHQAILYYWAGGSSLIELLLRNGGGIVRLVLMLL